MYLYTIPSSWYVTIHNKSIANRNTITIPVCEEEYKIIFRQYVIESQNEITNYCAICGPYIMLDLVYSYFRDVNNLENIIETIKMFAWFNCTNAVKMFDCKNDIISKYILSCSIKHCNNDLFYWIIDNMIIDSLNDFCKKNMNKLFKILKVIDEVIVIRKTDDKTILIDLFELAKKHKNIISYSLSLMCCET